VHRFSLDGERRGIFIYQKVNGVEISEEGDGEATWEGKKGVSGSARDVTENEEAKVQELSQPLREGPSRPRLPDFKSSGKRKNKSAIVDHIRQELPQPRRLRVDKP